MIFNIFKNTFVFVLFCDFLLTRGDKGLRLSGGYEASEYYGRFHASLQNMNGEHVCGGGVVSKRHIVTAAHCVWGVLEPHYIKIIVGTSNLDNVRAKHETEEITIHEQFDYDLKINDIAIVKSKDEFDQRFVETMQIHPFELVAGDFVFLTGFGAREVNGETSHVLYAVNSHVFDQETCKYAMRYTKNVTDSMFCTFTQMGEGTCNGDSGGPVIGYGKLVGLVSWGIPCAVGYPDVHTRITPYIQWIKEQVSM